MAFAEEVEEVARERLEGAEGRPTVQLEPAAVELMSSTVRPLSAGAEAGNVKVSLSVTFSAGEGPLLRNEST